MLTIRLQRTGRRNSPDFRIVLAEKHRAASKKAVEVFGQYNPRTKNFYLSNKDGLLARIKKHIEVSPTVYNLLIKKKLIEGKKIKAWRPKVKATEEQKDEGTKELKNKETQETKIKEIKESSAEASASAKASADKSADEDKQEEAPKTEGEEKGTAKQEPKSEEKKEEKKEEQKKEVASAPAKPEEGKEGEGQST